MTTNLDRILMEFERIQSCSNLSEAYPSPTDRRIWVKIFKLTGLWDGSFKRATKQLRSEDHRRQYKRQWALDHKESICNSRAAYLKKKRVEAESKQRAEVASVLITE